MNRKQHAAEIAAEAEMITAIREADHFVASLFVGSGRYEKRAARTVLAAQAAGRRLEDDFPNCRRHMLYAVQADDRAVFITQKLIERLLTPST